MIGSAVLDMCVQKMQELAAMKDPTYGMTVEKPCPSLDKCRSLSITSAGFIMQDCSVTARYVP